MFRAVADPYLSNLKSARPALVFNSLASKVPSFVRIGRIEALLDDSEVLVQSQRSFVVWISSGELLGAQSSCQFALVESAVMIAVQPRGGRGMTRSGAER